MCRVFTLPFVALLCLLVVGCGEGVLDLSQEQAQKLVEEQFLPAIQRDSPILTFEEGSEGYAYLAEYIQGAKLKPVRSFQNKEGRSIVDLEVFEPDDDSREWVKGIAKAVVRTKAWDVRKLTSIFSDKKQAPPKIETRNELRLFPNVFHLKIIGLDKVVVDPENNSAVVSFMYQEVVMEPYFSKLCGFTDEDWLSINKSLFCRKPLRAQGVAKFKHLNTGWQLISTP